MTRRQIAAMRRVVATAEANADRALRDYDRMRATFPEYNARDEGFIMDAARAVDDARRHARRLRANFDRIEARP